jgi:hypothetical protein
VTVFVLLIFFLSQSFTVSCSVNIILINFCSTDSACIGKITLFLFQLFEMNKLVLSFAVLLAVALLLPTSSAKENKVTKKRAFLDDLCEKCKYCETDPECLGCSECAKCENKKQEGCRFCRPKEDRDECVARCSKGCRICGGKDGTGLESCKKRGL